MFTQNDRLLRYNPLLTVPVEKTKPQKCFAGSKHCLLAGVASVAGTINGSDFLISGEDLWTDAERRRVVTPKLPYQAIPVKELVRNVGSRDPKVSVFHIQPRAQLTEGYANEALRFPPHLALFEHEYSLRGDGVGVVTVEKKGFVVPIMHDRYTRLDFDTTSTDTALACLRAMALHTIVAQN